MRSSASQYRYMLAGRFENSPPNAVLYYHVETGGSAAQGFGECIGKRCICLGAQGAQLSSREEDTGDGRDEGGEVAKCCAILVWSLCTEREM